MKLWVCNLGYYWWTLVPKDPGVDYVKTRKGTELFYQEFEIPDQSYDYMLWCTNVVQNWDTLKANWEKIDRLTGKKAYWSFDNHIWHEREIFNSSHFDYAFLAHENHLGPYKNIPHSWLPLCVAQFSMKELLDLLPLVINPERDIDLQFRGVSYQGHTHAREKILYQWFEHAEKSGFRCDLRLLDHTNNIADFHVQDYRRRAAPWLSSHSSICAPIKQDLSTRFFDGIFFGQHVFVPKNLPDVDSLFSSHVQEQIGIIRIDQHDPSVLNKELLIAQKTDYSQRLLQALFIILNHHINNRVAEAFNKWTGEAVVAIDYDRLTDAIQKRLKNIIPSNIMLNTIDKVLELGARPTDYKNASSCLDETFSKTVFYIDTKPGKWNRLQQGVRHRLLRNYEAAEEIFTGLIETAPEMTSALRELGITYHDQKLYNKAVSCFDQVLKIDEDSIQARYSKAFTLTCMNRLDEALDLLNDILQLQPGNPDALEQKKLLMNRLSSVCD